jgi:hypothetical protein
MNGLSERLLVGHYEKHYGGQVQKHFLSASGVMKDRSISEFSADFERAQTGFNFGLSQT